MASNIESLATTSKRLKSKDDSQEDIEIEDPFEKSNFISQHSSSKKMNEPNNLIDNDHNFLKKVIF
jgi:hypothetical protein